LHKNERSRIFERRRGRVIGRKDDGEEGLDVLGRTTIECFQAVGKIPVNKHAFRMNNNGSRQLGEERSNVCLEKIQRK